jgi:hypothetical protein
MLEACLTHRARRADGPRCACFLVGRRVEDLRVDSPACCSFAPACGDQLGTHRFHFLGPKVRRVISSKSGNASEQGHFSPFRNCSGKRSMTQEGSRCPDIRIPQIAKFGADLALPLTLEPRDDNIRHRTNASHGLFGHRPNSQQQCPLNAIEPAVNAFEAIVGLHSPLGQKRSPSSSSRVSSDNSTLAS